MHRTERSFTECFCVVLFEDDPFSTIGPLALRMSASSFYRKSVSGLLNQKKASSPLVESTEQKEDSQNASVEFLFEDIPFSTIGPRALQMSDWSFYRKCVSELLNQKYASTLLVDCTEQKEVSQNASVEFYLKIFLFPL